MRKLIIALLLIAPAFADAQIYTRQPWYGLQVARVLPDSVLYLPLDTARVRDNISRVGQVRWNRADSSLYVNSGTQWIKISGSGGGSIIAGNQLVKSGDTLGLRSSSPGASNALWFNPTLGSFAAGFNNIASGINSVALGASKASGSYSAAIGDNVQNPNNASLVIGDNNDPTNNVSNDVVFQAARNNVNRFEVRGNGQLLINDGTQSSGYVLTSDANGVTSWQAPASGADSTIFATQFRLDTVKANRVIIGSDAELRSLHITGTNGNGKLELRHQASLPTAGGQTTSLYANSNGNLAWKNDNLHHTTLATNHITADRSYRFQDKSYTLADSAVVLNRTDSTGNTGYTSLFQYNKGKDSLRALIPAPGWGLTGNSINAGNFIGSTNNASLRFRINNLERLVLDSNGRLNITNPSGGAEHLSLVASSGAQFQIINTNTLAAIRNSINNSSIVISAASGSNNSASLTLYGFTFGSSLSNGIELSAPRTVSANTAPGNVLIKAAGANTSSTSAGLNGADVRINGGENTGAGTPGNVVLANDRGRVVVGSTTVQANAQMQVVSTSRGFMPPVMTTAQRNAVTWVAGDAGMIIYCSDCTANDSSTGVTQTYNGSTWKNHY